MLHNGNYMNEIIENIAVQAGFIKDKYGLYWDNDDNTEGVDLEWFAKLIVRECMQVSMKAVEMDAEYEAWYLIKQHFGVSK